MELTKLLKGIEERYENIVLFFPLFQMGQSKKEAYNDYNLIEISLSVLLYILEKMLAESGSVTNSEITRFLQLLMKQRYNVALSHEEADTFRTYIVDDKLRNGGKKFLYPYLDEQGESKAIAFDLIQNEQWSIDKSKVRLVLTEKGIEMLFKTKEMYSEMQITITMLYFKQQLEKGSFSAALNAAKELLFQIDQQRKSIQTTAEQIKRNALSTFNQQRLEKQMKTSQEQTKQEREQLRELQGVIEQVKKNYQSGTLSKKHLEAYDTILQIDRLINKAKAQHELLFGEKQDLLITLTHSFQLLLDNVFLKKFYIEREIVDQWIEQKITEEKAGEFLRPIMPYHQPKVYNPFTAYQPQTTQRRREQNQESVITLDPELAEEYQKEKEKKEQEQYKKELDLLRIILTPLLTKERYVISDVLKELMQKDLTVYTDLVDRKLQDFLMLSIDLHRSDYKQFERVTQEEIPFATPIGKMLADLTMEYPDLEDIGAFEMLATDDYVEFADGTTLTNYAIRKDEN